MNINFALILLILLIVSGGIYLLDVLYFRPKKIEAGHLLREYARAFFPVFLVVLVLRSFLAEPFRIPSGSLEPTLLVGDFILVNKFTYGLRLPVWHKKIMSLNEPKDGDIVVFRWPPNPSIDYIKRFVGMPGDKISYINKVLYINGKQQPQKFLGYTMDTGPQGDTWKVEKRQEIINGVKHNIYVRPDIPGKDFTVTVPPGHYFAMGDNRDDSSDSRFWGFVPEKNIIGKAFFVWLSWNGLTDSVRWDRIGERVS